MNKLFLFGGTTEGRLMAEYLAEYCAEPLQLHVFTATEYGRELLLENGGAGLPETVRCHGGRLGQGEMAQLMKNEAPLCVIDGTHPYAREASCNIKGACVEAGLTYLRLLREEGIRGSEGIFPGQGEGNHSGSDGEGGSEGISISQGEEGRIVFVNGTKEAAEYLKNKDGRILLTTGSKELEAFCEEGLAARIYPRILPAEEGLRKCLALGIPAKNIICMQGPFSEDMNRALLRKTKATFLVTKESGKAGGLFEKLEAAKREGVLCILVGRPNETDGRSMEEIIRVLKEDLGLLFKKMPKEIFDVCLPGSHAWFPLFTKIAGRRVFMIGGGKVTVRRVRTLLKFDCLIEVVAKEPCAELLELQSAFGQRLDVLTRAYRPGDCRGAALVSAASDCRSVNHEAVLECAALGIPVSAADDQSESTFFFPAVIEGEKFVLGLSSEGKDHAFVRRTAEELRKIFGAGGWNG